MRILRGIKRLGIGQADLAGDQITRHLQGAHDDARHGAHKNAGGDFLRDHDGQAHGALRRNRGIIALNLRRQGKGDRQGQHQAHPAGHAHLADRGQQHHHRPDPAEYQKVGQDDAGQRGEMDCHVVEARSVNRLRNWALGVSRTAP
jgi:hypothetical protein